MLYKNLSIIILAAGNGKRMLSKIPKVMHKIAGKPMLQYLIDSVNKIYNGQNIYIVYNGDVAIKDKIVFNQTNNFVSWIIQDVPTGTGYAVKKALDIIQDDSEVLVLYGDVPFISRKTIEKLIFSKLRSDISLLTAEIFDPSGYGRIIRNKFGKVMKILEHNDVINNSYNNVKEINSGIFISVAKYIKRWLEKVIINNTKDELYLTEIIHVAYKSNYTICTITPVDVFEVMGVNNKLDLIDVEREYQLRQAKKLLLSGVIISDPKRFDLRGILTHGQDVFIDINVILEGYIFLGNRVQIGSGCILKNVKIFDDVVIYPFSIIEDTEIKCNSKIGPFSRLRPGTKIQERSYVGNFVELKNTQLGKQSKVGHLAYLGDASVGSQVNIGAGTIVCNYDGINKHHTIIEDNVFVGADSQLIAPVTIKKNATIGAGTTVTNNVSEGETIISRVRQFSISNRKYIKNGK